MHTNDDLEQLLPRIRKWVRAQGVRGRFGDGGDADDVLQAACLVAADALKTYDQARGYKIGTYVFSAIERRRSEILDGIRPIPDAGDLELDELPGRLNTPSFWEIAEGLSEREQSVLRAYYIEGKTDAEIGQEQGCTQQTINELRSRALEQLRNEAGLD